jgi:hypothetical protein
MGRREEAEFWVNWPGFETVLRNLRFGAKFREGEYT